MPLVVQLLNELLLDKQIELCQEASNGNQNAHSSNTGKKQKIITEINNATGVRLKLKDGYLVANGKRKEKTPSGNIIKDFTKKFKLTEEVDQSKLELKIQALEMLQETEKKLSSNKKKTNLPNEKDPNSIEEEELEEIRRVGIRRRRKLARQRKKERDFKNNIFGQTDCDIEDIMGYSGDDSPHTSKPKNSGKKIESLPSSQSIQRPFKRTISKSSSRSPSPKQCLQQDCHWIDKEERQSYKGRSKHFSNRFRESPSPERYESDFRERLRDSRSPERFNYRQRGNRSPEQFLHMIREQRGPKVFLDDHDPGTCERFSYRKRESSSPERFQNRFKNTRNYENFNRSMTRSRTPERFEGRIRKPSPNRIRKPRSPERSLDRIRESNLTEKFLVPIRNYRSPERLGGMRDPRTPERFINTKRIGQFQDQIRESRSPERFAEERMINSWNERFGGRVRKSTTPDTFQEIAVEPRTSDLYQGWVRGNPSSLQSCHQTVRQSNTPERFQDRIRDARTPEKFHKRMKDVKTSERFQEHSQELHERFNDRAVVDTRGPEIFQNRMRHPSSSERFYDRQYQSRESEYFQNRRSDSQHCGRFEGRMEESKKLEASERLKNRMQDVEEDRMGYRNPLRFQKKMKTSRTSERYDEPTSSNIIQHRTSDSRDTQSFSYGFHQYPRYNDDRRSHSYQNDLSEQALGTGEFQVIIMGDRNGSSLTAVEIEQIHSSLMFQLEKQLQGCYSGPQLRFRNSGSVQGGWFMLSCLDSQTRDWLLNWQPNTERRLFVLNAADAPQTVKISVILRSHSFDVTRMLKMLAVQNRHLRISEWLHVSTLGSGTSWKVRYQIPVNDLKKIEADGGEICYELSTLEVKQEDDDCNDNSGNN